MYNSRKVEEYIERAFKQIEDNYDKISIGGENKKIKKVYEGYVSALGPVIIQIGLVPAITYYLGSDSSEENRTYIIDMIIKIIEFDSPKQFIDEYNKKSKVDKLRMKENVESAIVALKHAIRTYDIL